MKKETIEEAAERLSYVSKEKNRKQILKIG